MRSDGRTLEGGALAPHMKMKHPQSLTALPQSPDDERRSRMRKYTIAMSIRVVCVVCMIWAEGWWLAVCAAGAIFLPYVAVVLANVNMSRPGAVERPGAILPTAPRERTDETP